MFRSKLLILPMLLLFARPMRAQNVSVVTTSGTQGFGSVLVTHTNNTTVLYPVTANTNAARGTALSSAVAALAQGDRLVLGPGTYGVATTLAIPADYVTFEGSGIQSSIIQLTNQGGSATSVSVINGSARRTGLTLKNLSIDCGLTLQSSTNFQTNAVTIHGSENTLSRVEGFNYGTTGTMGENFLFTLDTTGTLTAKNLRMEYLVCGAPATGVHHTSGVNAFNIIGTDTGLSQTDPTSTGAYWVYGGFIENCWATNIVCSTSGTATGQPTYFHGAGLGKVIGGRVRDCYFASIYGGAGSAGIYGDAVMFQDVILEGNIGWQIDDLIKFGPARANTKGVRVVNNFADITTPTAGTFAGIDFGGVTGAGLQDLTIENNTVISTNAASQGIAVNIAKGVQVRHNYFNLATGSNAVLITSATNAFQSANRNADGTYATGDSIAPTVVTNGVPGITATLTSGTLALTGTATNSSYAGAATSSVPGITAALTSGTVTFTGTATNSSYASAGTSSAPGLTLALASGTMSLTGTATPVPIDATITMLRALKNQETPGSNNGLLLTGSMKFTNGSATVTGTNTLFTTELRVGDELADISDATGFAGGSAAAPCYVTKITSDTSLTVSRTGQGTTGFIASRAYRATISDTTATGTTGFVVSNRGDVAVNGIPTNFGASNSPNFYAPGIVKLGTLALNSDAIQSSGGWQPVTTFNGNPNLVLGGTNSANGTTTGNITIGGNLTIGQTGGSNPGNLSVTGSSTLGTGGSPLKAVVTGTATLDFPSTNAGTSSTLYIAVSGAALNDTVTMGLPATTGTVTGCSPSAYVFVSGTVGITMTNTMTVTAIDLPSATYRVDVFEH